MHVGNSTLMFADHFGGVAASCRKMSRVRTELYSSKCKNVPDLFGTFYHRGQMRMIMCTQPAAVRKLSNLIECRPQALVIVRAASRDTLRSPSDDQMLSACIGRSIGH